MLLQPASRYENGGDPGNEAQYERGFFLSRLAWRAHGVGHALPTHDVNGRNRLLSAGESPGTARHVSVLSHTELSWRHCA